MYHVGPSQLALMAYFLSKAGSEGSAADRARAAAGFDYFASGVPDKAPIDRLARRLDELGQAHAGVHRASLGWILPEVLDPDGHALRFYTMEHHTDVAPGEVATIHDPRETAERLEREEASRA